MPDGFDLLETLRWTPDEGYFLLDRHLQRLEAAARRFENPLERARVVDALARAVHDASRPVRVRLLVDPAGRPRTDVSPLEPAPAVVRVGLAVRPINPANPFLLHKTTRREHLEQERLPGVDDTVLWNPAGEITETIIANIVVPMEARRVTPPVECGLLAGTFRAELLDRREIVERRVSVEELRRARRFWLINSVRGWYEAELAT